ncbi:MAG: hypothetical protein AAFO83_03100, partial [Cyanobacteria bacterium J06607_13]
KRIRLVKIAITSLARRCRNEPTPIKENSFGIGIVGGDTPWALLTRCRFWVRWQCHTVGAIAPITGFLR